MSKNPSRLDHAPRRRAIAVVAIVLAVAMVSACAAWHRHRPAIPKPAPKAPRTWGDDLPKPRQWTSHTEMHDYFVDRFVASDGFGGLRMAETRTVSRDQSLRHDGREYRVKSIELISLDPQAPGLHKPRALPADRLGPTTQPYAYVDPFSVTKKSLNSSSSRRAITEAERGAIDKLRDGDADVFLPDAKPPRLIGAIRATKSCLDCHEGAAGKLLGAFSYQLSEVR
jgi:hypothetical protein